MDRKAACAVCTAWSGSPSAFTEPPPNGGMLTSAGTRWVGCCSEVQERALVVEGDAAGRGEARGGVRETQRCVSAPLGLPVAGRSVERVHQAGVYLWVEGLALSVV